MCYKPFKVINNSKSFNFKTSSFYNVVPCNHCIECQDVRSSSWEVRTYYEYLHCVENGGQVFYYTLTFNNEHLPRFQGIPCFDYNLVDGFLKRLREHLSRRCNATMKVFLSSEFGDLKKRPHHHVLFYVTCANFEKKISPWFFKTLVADCWCERDGSSRYPYGFVKPGDNCGLVDSYHAVTYVCKYVCKDVSFSTNYFLILRNLVRLYLGLLSPSQLKSLPSLSRLKSSRVAKAILDPELYELRNQFALDFKHMVPFIKYSLGFGACALDTLSESDVLFEKIRMPFSNEFVYKPLPKYLSRKLFFDRVYNPTTGKRDLYRLNAKGMQHFEDKTIRNFSESLANNDKLYGYALQHLRDDAELEPLFEHYNDIRSSLPVYKELFRYHSIYYGWLDCSSDDLVTRIRESLYNRSIYVNDKFSLSDLSEEAYCKAREYIFDQFDSRSQIYELCQLTLDSIKCQLSEEKAKVKEKKRALQRRLKCYMKRDCSSPHVVKYKPLKFSNVV